MQTDSGYRMFIVLVCGGVFFICSMWICVSVLVDGGKCYRKSVKDEQRTRQFVAEKDSYRNGSEEVEQVEEEETKKPNKQNEWSARGKSMSNSNSK